MGCRLSWCPSESADYEFLLGLCYAECNITDRMIDNELILNNNQSRHQAIKNAIRKIQNYEVVPM